MRKWSKPPGWVSTEITVYSQYSNLNDNAALWLVLFLSPPFPMLGSDWSFTSLAPSRQMPLSDWSYFYRFSSDWSFLSLHLGKCRSMGFSVRNPVRGMYRGSWDKIQKSSLSVLESVPIRLGGLMLKVKVGWSVYIYQWFQEGLTSCVSWLPVHMSSKEEYFSHRFSLIHVPT